MHITDLIALGYHPSRLDHPPFTGCATCGGPRWQQPYIVPKGRFLVHACRACGTVPPHEQRYVVINADTIATENGGRS